MHIRMGTRGSALALAQCNEVKALLEKAYPQHSFEICVITTKGDRIQHVALDQMKDKGIFVKEIEQQLLEHTIDLAVHSMKDMPSVLDERLCFTETLLREDARDVLVLRNATSLESLPLHARIATGSKRRRFQLLRQREDLEIVGIRGNIETRLKKLEDQQLDGIVLAAAGLKRLQLAQYITQTLPEHILHIPVLLLHILLHMEVPSDQVFPFSLKYLLFLENLHLNLSLLPLALLLFLKTL